jgi:hypothetical protein
MGIERPIRPCRRFNKPRPRQVGSVAWRSSGHFLPFATDRLTAAKSIIRDRQAGGRPSTSMEDKWFVYFSEGWLNFHRSWTGALIYSLRLEGSPASVRVVDSWVNREPEQYKATDIEYDRKLLHFLIDALLLKKSAVFPMPASSEPAAPGVVQHSYVGRAYPEALASPADPAPPRRSGPWWKV